MIGRIKKLKFSKNAMLYLLAIVFFYISSGGAAMLQGIYIKELQLGESFLGVVLSARSIAIAVGSIPCAIYVNKYGTKKAIGVALLMVPICTIIQGYLMSKWWILIFSILQGIMGAFLVVSESAFLMKNSWKKNRIYLFSFSFANNIFSTMVGYLVFGYLSSHFTSNFNIIDGTRLAIIIAGIIGCIGSIFIAGIQEEKEPNKQNKGVNYKNIMELLKKKNVIKLLIVYFILGCGAGLVVPYFNIYLKYRLHASTEQVGIILALAMLANGIAGIFTPYIANRRGSVKTIVLCQILSVPFLIAIPLATSLFFVSIAIFTRNALMNMATPVMTKLSMELVEEEERSIFSSVNSIGIYLSRAISALIAGFIMKYFIYGYEIPYFITTILYVIGILFFYISFNSLNASGTFRE